jgi:hypothetical protein
MKEMHFVVIEISHIRLLSVAILNSMVMYQSLSNNKNIESLKCRLSLSQGLVEKHGFVFLLLYTAIHKPNVHPKDSQNNISWSAFLPPRRRQYLKRKMLGVYKIWEKDEAELCLDGRFKTFNTNLNV